MTSLPTFRIEVDEAEQQRLQRILKYERLHWRAGARAVAGLDEAGRGPLAGPVVAAAVVFTPDPDIPMVNDSKQLPESTREYLYGLITREAAGYGIGVATVAEIDRINILQASFLAMRRALAALPVEPDHLLVDGHQYPNEHIPFTTLVRGDSRSYSIAAASILAKVTRDRLMKKYDEQFPSFGFGRNKGYATQAHLAAIENFGFCEIHRRSFHPRRFFDKQMALFEDARE